MGSCSQGYRALTQRFDQVTIVTYVCASSHMSPPCINSNSHGKAAALVAELKRELEDQWGSNHAEHCDIDWPHRKGYACMWPQPSVLARASRWLEESSLREGLDTGGLVDDLADVDGASPERH
jgi:hypothetical protein